MLAGRNIIITGGTGFIGSHLLIKLIENKANIVLLGRDSNKPQISDLIEKRKINFIKYDLTKGDQNISTIIADADCLVHLGAFIPRSGASTDDDLYKSIKVNIQGTCNLLKDFQPYIKKIVFASTVDVYGIPVEIPINEQHPTNPVTYYGSSKLAAEKYLSVFSGYYSIKNTILRFSHVYGPGEISNKAIPNFIRMVINGEPPIIFGDGSDVRDYVYVDDVVNATILAIQKNCNGIYNVTSGKGYSISETAKRIIKFSKKDIKPTFKPGGKKPTKFIFDISKAQKDLGYFPKNSIDEGLTKEIGWYERNLRGGGL